MTQYVCNELVKAPYIYQGRRKYDCKTWVELEKVDDKASIIDSLAISVDDANSLAITVLMIYITAFTAGLIGRIILRI